MAGVGELRLGGLDDLAKDLVSPAGVVANALDGVGDVGALGPVEGLAIVEGLEGGELVDILLHEVGELVHEARAVVAGGVEAPCGGEGLVGSFDGEVDILGRALCDLGERLACGGVDDAGRTQEGSALLRRRPGRREKHSGKVTCDDAMGIVVPLALALRT